MATKAELIKRCEELGIDPGPLTNNDQREAAIAAKEAELAASVDVKDPVTEDGSQKSDAAAEAEAKAKAEEAEEKAAAEKAKAEAEAAEKAKAEKEAAEKAQAEKEAAAKAKAEKAAAKKAAAEKAAAEKAEAEAAFYEDSRGRKWKFKPTAPKTIRIGGHPLTQKEILETEEIISELVYGNCSFLTQIHDKPWLNV